MEWEGQAEGMALGEGNVVSTTHIIILRAALLAQTSNHCMRKL